MGKRKNGKGPFGQRTEIISGRSNINYASSSNNVLPIYPASFSRSSGIADLFQFYRFTKLRVIVTPVESTIFCGYAPGAAFDTPPANGPAIIELPRAVCHAAFKHTDTVLDVGRSELIKDSQIPWFKTIVGTPATQFEIQGNLYTNVNLGAGQGAILIIEWTCEFQSWNLASQSPMVKTPQEPIKEPSSDTKENTGIVIIGGVTYKRSLG